MATKQTYHVWQNGDNYRFRWAGITYSIPWNLKRQEELLKVLGRWYEGAEPLDPRQTKPEEPDHAHEQ